MVIDPLTFWTLIAWAISIAASLFGMAVMHMPMSRRNVLVCVQGIGWLYLIACPEKLDHFPPDSGCTDGEDVLE